ncbi:MULTISPECIES: nucleoside-diphosphate kinase [unclassified Bradyrhizobium]|uniref:nucleoside-diphosphate kinase n=1 Tax=unclassified Bradyrhizobium TaxID=2631580 RepID=UPI002916D954|nr:MULTISPECIES: nucleoside-diphosphate kinase [unclassified Bradyrhizobium]
MLVNVLTPNVVKRRVYLRDSEFNRAIEAARNYWLDPARMHDCLWNSAALLLRPDAIAGRQSTRIFAMLRLHGFIPVAAQEVQVRCSQVEELWKYQFNVATAERRSLLKRLLAISPSVYIMLHDVKWRSSAPATVHLTYLKGTAVVANRKRWHLRTLAGPPIANLLSYVHVSDEPADVLREMAVLFDVPTQISMFQQLDAGVDRTTEAMTLIRKLEALAPRDALTGMGQPSFGDEQNLEVQKLRRGWKDIVERARVCRSFVSGETYVGKEAIVPDDKELALPLDGHLIFQELGPR